MLFFPIFLDLEQQASVAHDDLADLSRIGHHL
jgi:hypothetical protein